MLRNYCKFQKLIKIPEKLHWTLKITRNLEKISEHQNSQHINAEKSEQNSKFKKKPAL